MARSRASGADPFYWRYSVLLIAVVLGGFGLNGVLRPHSLPEVSGLVVSHGLIMFAWYVALLVQTRLVRAKKTKLHMRLGTWSFVAAIGAVVSGIAVSIESYPREANAEVLMANVAMLINFSVFYALGYRSRRGQFEAHKRWMLLAGAAMLGPALGRVCLAFGAPGPLTLPLWLLVLAPMFVHDIGRGSRIHGPTVVGSIATVLGVGVAIGLAQLPGVQSLLDQLLG